MGVPARYHLQTHSKIDSRKPVSFLDLLIALLKKCFVISVFVGVIWGICLLSDIDDKLGYVWTDLRTDQSVKDSSIWLPDYEAFAQQIEIAGVDKNLSGITYDYDHDTFWVIQNNPQRLVELDKELTPTRTVDL